MQALDSLIRLARIEGILDLRCLLNGPLEVDHAPEPPGVASYHVVLSGRCRLRRADGVEVELAAGDIAVLPRGDSHSISVPGDGVEPISVRKPVTDFNGTVLVRSNLESGAPGHAVPGLDLLCGRFAYAAPASLMDALPDLIQVKFTEQPLEWMVMTLRRESEDSRAGAGAIVTAISTALFAMIMRCWLASEPKLAGILALLTHRRIGLTMIAMLGSPGEEWTLAKLAEHAAMSRASFMRAYGTLSSEPPLHWLSTLRMQLAARLLAQSSRKIGDVAAEVGYNSEAAFSKRFKEVFGKSPGQYRQDLRSGDAGVATLHRISKKIPENSRS